MTRATSIRAAAAAITLALSVSSGAAEGLSEVIPAEPGSPEFAIATRVAESLALPAPEALSTADLDNDGFPELLFKAADGVHIVRLGAVGWVDISAGQLAGVAALGDIAVLPQRFNGFATLRAGSTELAWSRGVYRTRESIEPTALDSSVFTPSCEKSEDIALLLEENGANASEAPGFCSCLLDEWQARDAGQRILDIHARELGGVFLPDDRDEREEAETLFATTDEAQFACRTQRGWEAALPAPFGQPVFNGKARGEAAATLIDVCRGQDWVVANRVIGTPARALGFCGCLAGALSSGGMSEKGISLVAGLYSGELSDNDVAEQDGSVTSTSDDASEACLQSMPWR